MTGRSLAFLALLLLGTAVVAQVQIDIGGDPEAGKQKAATCAACHGASGNATNPQWPNLAGQHATYLFEQLTLFKSGERKNPIMQAQVASLSEQDMRDLAAYYATLTMEVGAASKEVVELGRQIYRGGLAEEGIPACAACHGPAGYGNAPAVYPRIGGQNAVYVASQLQAYRSNERAGYGRANIMVDVAAGLTDAEIKAVASYVSGLYAPSAEK